MAVVDNCFCMAGGVFLQHHHPGENLVGALLNDTNLFFQSFAHFLSIIGNLVAETIELVFLLLEQSIECRGLFIKTGSNVGGIFRRTARNFMQFFTLGLKVIGGTAESFQSLRGALADFFVLAAQNILNPGCPFGHRLAQQLNILILHREHIFKLGHFGQSPVSRSIKLVGLVGQIVINRFALINNIVAGSQHGG